MKFFTQLLEFKMRTEKIVEYGVQVQVLRRTICAREYSWLGMNFIEQNPATRIFFSRLIKLDQKLNILDISCFVGKRAE